ncbi:hypothetical protein BGX38DRAFT_1160852 [Terfezia claveryi]|nr:hypothetical protein BGX38DRAFT_1160852 [Terfezia claveryi]
MTLPKAHSAIQLTDPGPSPTVSLNSNIPLPTLQNGHVLVKNTYAGINYIENYFISGIYQAPSYPYTLGREGEGIIVAVSQDLAQHPDPTVHDLKVGDRVAYLEAPAYSQYSAAPVDKVLKLPEGLAEGLGAAVLLQGLTAITLATASYPAKKGDIVLVHAAAGGVGLFLVRYLNKVIGARVIATASSEGKLALAKENGAEWAFLYGPSGNEWIEAVKSIPEVNKRRGVAGIYDSVAKATFEGGLEVIAVKGTFVNFGNASGPVEPFSLSRLMPKNIAILRPQLFPYIRTRAEFTRYADELVRLINEGTLKVKSKVYPWEKFDQALQDIRSRRTTGKLILKIT